MSLPLPTGESERAPTGPAPAASGGGPRSAGFRRERERTWRELEALVDRVERGGLSSLSGPELHRLPSLYRATVSALAVARSTSLDKNLLDYLTALVGRSYIAIYASRRPLIHSIAEFVAWRFPSTVRRNALLVALSFSLLLAGVLSGWCITMSDPERYTAIVPSEMSSGRDPSASTEQLRSVLYDDGGGWVSELNLFATFLFTHNSKVAIVSFALGFAAALPTVCLIFYNGLSLGAMAALYHQHGLGLEFWAWVLPHGVTELGAIVLCGAGGLALGLALVFPGRHTRLENLAIRGRDVSTIAIGAVGMLFIAALFEGFFRQLVHPVAIRLTVAAVMLLFWGAYFAFAGRRADGRMG